MPSKTPRRSTGERSGRALRARPRPSQRPRRFLDRDRGEGLRQGRAAGDRVRRRLPPARRHRLGAGARPRDCRADDAAARPDRTAAAPALRSRVRAGGLRQRAPAARGRGKRHPALSASQERLRGADRRLDPRRADRARSAAASGFPRVEAQATGRERSCDAWAPSLPRPSGSRSRRSVAPLSLSARPSDQAAGRVQPEAKISRATARLTAAGRTREQAATEVGWGDPGIQVSEARTPQGQAECGVWGHPPFGPVNPSVNPQGKPQRKPQWNRATDICQRSAVAPKSGEKRLCGGSR